MKIAIIGTSSKAREAADYFQSLGADVRVFSQVERVHKARLKPSETSFKQQGRFADLFRVVYSDNPSAELIEQTQANPEVFGKLDQGFLDSLHEAMEHYQDFDVIMTDEELPPAQSGLTRSGTLALNESRAQNWITREPVNLAGQRILVVGNDPQILDQLNEDYAEVSWITYEQDFKSSLWSERLQVSELHFQNAVADYQNKLHEWRNLEDYIKVKIAKPEEPKRKIAVLDQHSLVAIDRLIDQKETFITIENIETEELQTLRVDRIVNAQLSQEVMLGLNLSQRNSSLVPSEPGFYFLDDLKEIESDLMKKFSQQEQE